MYNPNNCEAYPKASNQSNAKSNQVNTNATAYDTVDSD